jgi:folylpolyglutamate synthase/dihydrofolate synthase
VDIQGRLREIEAQIASRRAEHQIDPTLARIEMLTGLLGDPQRTYPVIHITGTNGKTSTARMIDTLLRERGLRTGRFTSPHLVSMRERITIDGEPIDAERFIELYEEILPYVELTDDKQPAKLSFFEVLVGMAFAAFADAPVDVAIIEVGVGGRWDATNVADGAVAVIGPVALDHMNYLGDTIEQIASEKAGIIKPGAIVILAQQQLAAAEVLLRAAAQQEATVAREGLEFGVLSRELAVGGQQLALRGLRGEYDGIFLPLFGAYQASNAAVTLAAVEAFAGSAADTGAAEHHGPLDIALVRDGFAKVASPGRLEIVRTSPTVIIDAAHNPAGMAAAAEAVVEAFPYMQLTGVVAVAADKDVPGLLSELEPVLGDIVVTRNSLPRSLDPEDLAVIARDIFGADRVHVAARLDDAIDVAVTLADEADMEGAGEAGGTPGSTGVLITGSVVTAGDARALIAPDRGTSEPLPGTPARASFTKGDLS